MVTEMKSTNKVIIMMIVVFMLLFTTGCTEKKLLWKDVRNIDPCPADTFCELMSFGNSTVTLNLTDVADEVVVVYLQ
jgi:hypothetical protein